MDEKELHALVTLLDDPDQLISEEIENKLLSLGPEIIPSLEEYWESAFDPFIQERLEKIIHAIQFDQIKSELLIWKMSNSFNLLEGLIIINSYQYPSYDNNLIRMSLEELKRDIWMELRYEMTPYEKVSLMNYVLFDKFGLSGNTNDYHNPQNSFIGRVLETKKGNPLTLSCIYSIVAQKLDIPIFGINLPKHFILSYLDEDQNADHLLFYLNAFNKGQVMQKADVISFLKQLNLPLSKEFMLPCDNVTILKRVLRNLVTAYEQNESVGKKQEIEILFKLLEE
ncbi:MULTISPECIES: transglutaminase-like domain-containing protein [Sphingobacterium]|uniref:Transglutaminase-like domain-containing protein n=1 Tax=Sphingobacterium kitahiroshimense TaxID=470446 RepID=A0ABV0BXT4_9SPHI|nr:MULTISPECIES: transglutaminase-like domain-containing protein [unclassified Sphingobacterium]MBB2952728.1 regulator of sirC expression with transglutaminase-like and TPR domain [Sphingobacterium sp. JUb56]MCS3555600.1 regulator of sirC expression with transglutaminase-like and TPR domain [Sphingobacterium sp. JUb21]TCR02248.1 transglutaminase superfamily protein [Sphingobacterium sp. JUb20]